MTSSVIVYVATGVALAVLAAIALTWALPDENRVIPPPGVGDVLSLPDFGGERDPRFVEKGRVYYAQVCLPCHGVTGDGFGEWAFRVSPRPANLRSERTQKRTDAELLQIISDGLTGTSMNGWKTRLSNLQRQQVVAYVRTLGRQESRL